MTTLSTSHQVTDLTGAPSASLTRLSCEPPSYSPVVPNVLPNICTFQRTMTDMAGQRRLNDCTRKQTNKANMAFTMDMLTEFESTYLDAHTPLEARQVLAKIIDQNWHHLRRDEVRSILDCFSEVSGYRLCNMTKADFARLHLQYGPLLYEEYQRIKHDFDNLKEPMRDDELYGVENERENSMTTDTDTASINGCLYTYDSSDRFDDLMFNTNADDLLRHARNSPRASGTDSDRAIINWDSRETTNGNFHEMANGNSHEMANGNFHEMANGNFHETTNGNSPKPTKDNNLRKTPKRKPSKLHTVQQAFRNLPHLEILVESDGDETMDTMDGAQSWASLPSDSGICSDSDYSPGSQATSPCDQSMEFTTIDETSLDSLVASSENLSVNDDHHEEQPAVEVKKKGGRGRPQKGKGKYLWEFLIQKLISGNADDPKLICWLDRKNGIFKINKSEALARCWGEKKQNPYMNYEKMSRALRYYAKGAVGKMTSVSGRRVFQFGPTLPWQEYYNKLMRVNTTET